MWYLAFSLARSVVALELLAKTPHRHRTKSGIDSVIEPPARNELHWTLAVPVCLMGRLEGTPGWRVLWVWLLFWAKGKAISGQTINGQRCQLARHFRSRDLVIVVVIVVNVVTACCCFFIFLWLVELKFDNAKAKASRRTDRGSQAIQQVKSSGTKTHLSSV